MAQRQKQVVGLDIDPVGIHAVQISGGDVVTVQRSAHVALEPGIFRDGEIVDVEALTEALKSLYSGSKGLDRRVRIGIANQKVVVRTIDLPPIEDEKELDAAVRFQAQDEVPMPLDQAVLDWQSLGNVDTDNGPRLRVQIVAARRDMVERFVAAIRGAGLRLDGIDLGAFAMVRALGAAAPADEAVLYAEVGGITNLAVAMGQQCLFTRASGTGLEGLAVELAERRQLTLEHARGWLQHVGLDTPVELVDGDPGIVQDARRVLEEGVRRIASEIRQSLDFHHLQSAGAASVSRAVLTGGAIGIPGFAEAVGLELGLPVERASVAGEPDDVARGDLTIAAGLACGGAPSANLIPEDERRAAGVGGRSNGAVYAVLGAMAMLLVLAAAYVTANNGVTSKQDELTKVSAQAAAAEHTAAQLSAYTDFSTLRQKRISTVTDLAKSRYNWAHLLGEVARTLPSNVWLTSMDGSVGPVAPGVGGATAAPTGGAPTLTIVGCTTSQGNVARMMATMRRIDGVEQVSLASSEKAENQGDGGGGGGGVKGGSSSDCRNGHAGFPQFTLKLTLTAPAVPPATSTPATPGGTASTGATGPTGDTGSAAPAATTSSTSGGDATPASNTGGGAQ